ncbi:hypothetical protein [Streptosporangium saharense]|uniref:hypothetical protein n=1 Tax=Streptosporangium saharense TaxID=1706840 RepID=UPI00369C01C4
MTALPRLPDTPAVRAVERLRLALARRGIGARTYGGYGLALLTVDCLIVWCNGYRFWWCAGWDARRGRPVMGSQDVGHTERTARRVEFHLARLRQWQADKTPPANGNGS